MIEIAEDFLVEFSFELSSRSPRSHAVISGVTGEPTIWCMTRAGRKIHIFVTETGMTACGLDGSRMVLAERSPPRSAVCEWCRGAT